MQRPLAIDLFTGLHGWAVGLIAEGWRVIGYDIEDMSAQFGEEKPEHFELIIRDVLTIHGSELADADLIVGSSPCQEFSYRAMPWKRAKALGPPELGMALFHAQFRIQREANEARAALGLPPIPLVVENVRGAQKWVGRAAWNHGSYYLWGDVPALMPSKGMDGIKVPSFRFDGSGKSFQTESVHRTTKGHGYRFTEAGPDETISARQGWFNDHPRTKDSLASSSSKSPARKAASAKIAKIPLALSTHIARVWKP